MFINERLKLALKSFMSKENITQKELALKFGITPMTVSRWMSGHTDRMAPDVWKRMRKQVEPFLPEEKLDERSDVLQIQVKSLDDVTGQSTKHSNIIIPKVETDISAFELTVYEGQISYRRLIIAKSTSEITENEYVVCILDDHAIVGWCEGVLQNKIFISSDGAGTAKVVEKNACTFIGRVIEIRTSNYRKA